MVSLVFDAHRGSRTLLDSIASLALLLRGDEVVEVSLIVCVYGLKNAMRRYVATRLRDASLCRYPCACLAVALVIHLEEMIVKAMGVHKTKSNRGFASTVGIARIPNFTSDCFIYRLGRRTLNVSVYRAVRG